MCKRLFELELIGAFVIIIVGSLLHFCYEWSGKWPPAALICAVNESVWEHMKIGFWPAFFFMVFEYFYIGDRPQNFLFAKAVGLALFSLTIPVLYYGYTAVTGEHYLVVDILIFVVAAFLAQWASYRLLCTGAGEELRGVALVALLLMVFAYSTFTYYPPKVPLFENPQGGGYGIQSR